MARSAYLLLPGVALVFGLVSGSGEARVGVDEDAPRPATGGASRSTATDSVTEYDAKEGGFSIRSEDGKYRLVIGGRLQAGFDAVAYDDVYGIDDTYTFNLRQARLFLFGNVRGDATSYFVQLSADAPDSLYEFPVLRSRSFRVEDAWFKHEYSEAFAVKLGQFKVPFSRQNITSSGKLQFPVRSLATLSLLSDRRDVGLEASGAWDLGTVMYALAIVNGDGPNTLNVDDKLSFYGRISWNPTGDYGYGEGSLGGSDQMSTTLGGAFHYQQDVPLLDGADLFRFNLDGGLKKGAASLQAEMYLENIQPTQGGDDTLKSFYVQGGWFLSPEKYEVVGRASRLIIPGSGNDTSEYSAGLNAFVAGQRLKWQTAYSFIDQELGSANNHRLISMMQLWF